MTLAQTFLPKLGEHRPPSPGRHVLAHADTASGWSVTATIERADALSCQLWEIALHRARPATNDPAALAKWANEIANRVTGLMEPLQVLEIDNMRNEALLRSEAVTERRPERQANTTSLPGGAGMVAGSNDESGTSTAPGKRSTAVSFGSRTSTNTTRPSFNPRATSSAVRSRTLCPSRW